VRCRAGAAVAIRSWQTCIRGRPGQAHVLVVPLGSVPRIIGSYGPCKTAHQRFTRWAADGTWARMTARAVAPAELDDDIDGDASADATIVRTHQHTAGAAKSG
jgi:hypothetical protein